VAHKDSMYQEHEAEKTGLKEDSKEMLLLY